MNFSLEYALRARGRAAPKKAKSRSYALIVIVVVPTAAAAAVLYPLRSSAAAAAGISQQAASVSGRQQIQSMQI